MLFNSLDFVVFLMLVASGYHLCPLRWRPWYLVGSSYAFYCTWSVPFAVLLLAVTLVAFMLGKRIESNRVESRRGYWVAAGIVLLFLPLAVLKYASVLLPNVPTVSGAAWSGWLSAPNTIAAVGISYYTFKLASYVVEVYWQRIEPCTHFASFASYAAFFPQILSGPIQRPGDFLGQMRNLRKTDPDMVASGLRLMLFGYFKKLVVADKLGLVVDHAFSHPQQSTGFALAVASYLFALQLYADFSGLTDIAIGTSRVLGFSAPQNFDSPFYAENIQEFWRRWHMTLTGWLTDYLFTPLRMGFRSLGQLGLVISLVINMVAIGIWHGAAWTFVVFGLIHAAYMTAFVLTQKQRKRLLQRRPLLRQVHAVVGPLVTFNLVVISLVVWRAASLTDGWYILSHAAHGLVTAVSGIIHGYGLSGVVAGSHFGASPGDLVIAAIGVVMMETVHIMKHNGSLPQLVAGPVWVRWAAYYALGFAILLWGESGARQFIYARF
jgi:alginate O-acetyltransferase complex protein AlgI